MKTIDVLVVRIYLMESENLLNKVVSYLKDDAKIRGMSVFRALRGFGETGTHSATMLDLSLSLPITIEFFDTKDKVEPALAHLSQTIKPEHVVFWEAKVNA